MSKAPPYDHERTLDILEAYHRLGLPPPEPETPDMLIEAQTDEQGNAPVGIPVVFPRGTAARVAVYEKRYRDRLAIFNPEDSDELPNGLVRQTIKHNNGAGARKPNKERPRCAMAATSAPILTEQHGRDLSAAVTSEEVWEEVMADRYARMVARGTT